MKFDRRIIFLLVFIVVAMPIIFPLNSPVTVTPEVRAIYNDIEKLPAGSPVLIGVDYEPSDSPEVDPMTIAILQQCFQKNLRVIVCSIQPTNGTGAGIAEKWLKKIANQMHKVNGTDYVNLGFKTGTYAVVIGMGENLLNTFPKDYNGNDTKNLPVLKGVHTLKDISYMVDIHDDSSVFTWITYGYERYGIKIGAGSTAVMAVGNYASLQAKQLTGIIGGLKGASEYEKLMGYRGWASNGMDSQGVMHLFIIVLLILGNIMYFFVEKKKIK